MGHQPEIYQGLDRLAHDLAGFCTRWRYSLKKLSQRAEYCWAISQNYVPMNTDQLQQALDECRAAYGSARGRDPQITVKTLAMIAELSSRSLGKRPYTVQLMGALAMGEGLAAEMATGEGKTLTAGLAAVLAAWRGKPVHVVTSNDYLAGRDAQLMAPLFQYCGLTVGAINSDDTPDVRQQSYACDITYATSNNLLADYLKDRMIVDYDHDTLREKIFQLSPSPNAPLRVMRGLHTAIIDEADSVLVDDALTPLIISMTEKDEVMQAASLAAKDIADAMRLGEHYRADHATQTLTFTEAGKSWVEAQRLNFPTSWQVLTRCLFMARQALMAKCFYELHRQYVILEGKIVIVDEKTGRLMSSRSWSHGLHQAIEAKEGIPFSDPTKTSVKMSFQNFFRQYEHLSGMSGTFQSVSLELWRVYGLAMIRIPSRRPLLRDVLPEQIFLHRQDKIQAIAQQVQKIQAQNRPILIGVRSIQDSHELSEGLLQHHIDNTVLNALSLETEAQIISQAGEAGRITIATNMAGRGTDIILSPEVIELGGLHVIATERNDSRRVDLQLFGRCSRQGQPGSAIAMLSLDDDMMTRCLPKSLWNFLSNYFHVPAVPWLTLIIYRCLQILGARHASKMRMRILLQDMEFRKMLSFAQH